MASKAEDAFRTIGEVSAELGLPQHILRYWETRFPQLRPVTRAGNRRYYRPADVALVRRIDQALNRDGYTIKGVQKMLADKAPPPASLGRTQTPPRVAAEDVVRLLDMDHQILTALKHRHERSGVEPGQHDIVTAIDVRSDESRFVGIANDRIFLGLGPTAAASRET